MSFNCTVNTTKGKPQSLRHSASPSEVLHLSQVKEPKVLTIPRVALLGQELALKHRATNTQYYRESIPLSPPQESNNRSHTKVQRVHAPFLSTTPTLPS